jgi:NAD(P)-dependent dehydrogenase (short-subunit alcohol dehydrogenase family)
VEIVRRTERMGAFSLCLSHQPTDRLCYLEYDGASLQVDDGKDEVMTTNHCLLHGSQGAPPHSAYRLSRLRHLLGSNGRRGYTLALAQAALRDRYDLGRQRTTTHPTMNTIQRADNQVSIVMRPAAGEAWVTPGPLIKETADSYFRLDLKELIGWAGSPAPPLHRGADVAASEASGAPASEEEAVPAVQAGPVMCRYVLRTAEAALDEQAQARLHLHGPALILGQNPTAIALRGRLEELGAAVVDLPVGDDPEETLAALDRAWQAAPAPHLFLLTARDEDGASVDDVEAWSRRRRRGLVLPYLVSQRWTRRISEASLLNQATLVAATALGGDFGLSGHGAAVEGGGLAGLLKSLRREFPGLAVKVIDAPAEEAPAAVAAAMCRELAAGATEAEVAYVRGRRCLVRAIPRPAMPREGWEIARGGTWVVTGGARGITAVVARELGRRFGLRLHLIGKSPAPRIPETWQNLSDADWKQLKLSTASEARQSGRDPAAAWAEIEKTREIDRTLRAFAADGVRATYHSCDVSDRAALAKVLDQIRQVDGPIHGIIHGAGVEAAGRFDRKKVEAVTATIAAKVDGAAALMALTRADPLTHFVAFGSISGRFGGHGQTDYALASDMLCKLVGRFRAERPGCASVAIHWPPWDQVGMAVRPETKIVLAVAKQTLMPPDEGVEHLIAELRAGAPEGEVLFIDRPGRLDLDKTAPTPSQGEAYRRRQHLISEAPLLEGVYALREGRSLMAEARFDPAADPFLRDHLFHGQPLLPAVIGLEALAEAAAVLDCGRTVVGLRDVQIPNGLRFRSGQIQDVRIRATLGDRGVECQLSADFYGQHGKLIDPQRVYVTGIVDLADRPAPVPLPPWDPPPGEWSEMQHSDDPRGGEGSSVYHGRTFRCLRSVSLVPGGVWGRILAPAVSEVGGSRGSRWRLPAAVLDACLVACGVFARKQLEIRQLPRAFDRLRIHRLPRIGELCTVRANFRSRDDGTTCFDFTLGGDDGTVILDAEGHRCAILSGS